MALKPKSTKAAASTATLAHIATTATTTETMQVLWPQVALRMAAKQVAAHLDSGAKVDQRVDEFVIRQLLREVLVDSLSTAFVNKKESIYPKSDDRLDLLIGLPKQEAQIAVEIKSDPSNTDGVKADWEKICAADAPYKMVIFSGIASARQFSGLQKKFGQPNYALPDGSAAHLVTCQQMSFEDSAAKKRVSFVWIWSVGVNRLPAIEFQITSTTAPFITSTSATVPVSVLTSPASV